MKTKKRNSTIVLMLVSVLMLCLSACAENSGVAGGDFAKQSSLIDVFSTDGNTTITLTGDETIDLNGVSIIGRKEIFLNNFSLKLTGQLAVSEEGVIDIKPGEGFTEGVIDLRDLCFDVSQVPDDLPHELSIIEIRPGVAIIKPETGAGFRVMEFPGILTAIVYLPAEQPADELVQGGDEGGQNNPLQVPQQQTANINLVKHDGGYFSVMLPEGWQIQTMGQYTTFGFRAWDPQNPDYEIFYYGNLGPLNKSYDAKNGWASYIGNMGFPSAELYYDAPVVTMDSASSVFYTFDALQAISDKYGFGFSLPALGDLMPQTSIPIETAYAGASTGETMIFAGVRGSKGGACGGMLMASLWNTNPYFVGGVDMSPTSAMHVTGVIAPTEDFLNVEATLTQAVFSLRFTEEYIQDAIAYSKAVGEAAMASNAALQAVFDKANKAWSEYFRGSPTAGGDDFNNRIDEINDMLDRIRFALD